MSRNDDRAPLARFIVFEGIDGSGTTTQTRRLSERLRATGVSAWLTSEPTGGTIGRVVRQVLSGEIEASPETIAYLFAADRSDHLTRTDGILEHLERGDLVICDRYAYSSRAYQGVEADPRLVHELNARFPEPAVVFFLDLPVSEVDARLAGRELREIYERTEFQARVRERYVEVLSAVPDTTRVVTLDATAPEDEIAEKIWETLEKASIL